MSERSAPNFHEHSPDVAPDEAHSAEQGLGASGDSTSALVEGQGPLTDASTDERLPASPDGDPQDSETAGAEAPAQAEDDGAAWPDLLEADLLEAGPALGRELHPADAERRQRRRDEAERELRDDVLATMIGPDAREVMSEIADPNSPRFDQATLGLVVEQHRRVNQVANYAVAVERARRSVPGIEGESDEAYDERVVQETDQRLKAKKITVPDYVKSGYEDYLRRVRARKTAADQAPADVISADVSGSPLDTYDDEVFGESLPTGQGSTTLESDVSGAADIPAQELPVEATVAAPAPPSGLDFMAAQGQGTATWVPVQIPRPRPPVVGPGAADIPTAAEVAEEVDAPEQQAEEDPAQAAYDEVYDKIMADFEPEGGVDPGEADRLRSVYEVPAIRTAQYAKDIANEEARLAKEDPDEPAFLRRRRARDIVDQRLQEDLDNLNPDGDAEISRAYDKYAPELPGEQSTPVAAEPITTEPEAIADHQAPAGEPVNDRVPVADEVNLGYVEQHQEGMPEYHSKANARRDAEDRADSVLRTTVFESVRQRRLDELRELAEQSGDKAGTDVLAADHEEEAGRYAGNAAQFAVEVERAERGDAPRPGETLDQFHNRIVEDVYKDWTDDDIHKDAAHFARAGYLQYCEENPEVVAEHVEAREAWKWVMDNLPDVEAGVDGVSQRQAAYDIRTQIAAAVSAARYAVDVYRAEGDLEVVAGETTGDHHRRAIDKVNMDWYGTTKDIRDKVPGDYLQFESERRGRPGTVYQSTNGSAAAEADRTSNASGANATGTPADHGPMRRAPASNLFKKVKGWLGRQGSDDNTPLVPGVASRTSTAAAQAAGSGEVAPHRIPTSPTAPRKRGDDAGAAPTASPEPGQGKPDGDREGVFKVPRVNWTWEPSDNRTPGSKPEQAGAAFGPTTLPVPVPLRREPTNDQAAGDPDPAATPDAEGTPPPTHDTPAEASPADDPAQTRGDMNADYTSPQPNPNGADPSEAGQPGVVSTPEPLVNPFSFPPATPSRPTPIAPVGVASPVAVIETDANGAANGGEPGPGEPGAPEVAERLPLTTPEQIKAEITKASKAMADLEIKMRTGLINAEQRDAGFTEVRAGLKEMLKVITDPELQKVVTSQFNLLFEKERVAMAKEPNFIVRGLQHHTTRKILGWVKKAKKPVMVLAAAGAVITLGVGVASGGTAVALGVLAGGAAKGMITGFIAGGGMADITARISRNMDRTKGAIQARVEAQRGDFQFREDADGNPLETYKEFVDRLDVGLQAVQSAALDKIRQNAKDYREAMGTGVRNGVLGGALMGSAVAGLTHLSDIAHAANHLQDIPHADTGSGTEGLHNPTDLQGATPPTPDQINHAISDALANNPDQAAQLPGAEHLHIAHRFDLLHNAHHDYPGDTTWRIMQNHVNPDGSHLTDAQIHQQIPDTLTTLKQAGFRIDDMHGFHTDATGHVTPSSETYWFGKIHSPNVQINIVDANGVHTIPPNTVLDHSQFVAVDGAFHQASGHIALNPDGSPMSVESIIQYHAEPNALAALVKTHVGAGVGNGASQGLPAGGNVGAQAAQGLHAAGGTAGGSFNQNFLAGFDPNAPNSVNPIDIAKDYVYDSAAAAGMLAAPWSPSERANAEAARQDRRRRRQEERAARASAQGDPDDSDRRLDALFDDDLDYGNQPTPPQTPLRRGYVDISDRLPAVAQGPRQQTSDLDPATDAYMAEQERQGAAAAVKAAEFVEPIVTQISGLDPHQALQELRTYAEGKRGYLDNLSLPARNYLVTQISTLMPALDEDSIDDALGTPPQLVSTSQPTSTSGGTSSDDTTVIPMVPMGQTPPQQTPAPDPAIVLQPATAAVEADAKQQQAARFVYDIVTPIKKKGPNGKAMTAREALNVLKQHAESNREYLLDSITEGNGDAFITLVEVISAETGLSDTEVFNALAGPLQRQAAQPDPDADPQPVASSASVPTPGPAVSTTSAPDTSRREVRPGPLSGRMTKLKNLVSRKLRRQPATTPVAPSVVSSPPAPSAPAASPADTQPQVPPSGEVAAVAAGDATAASAPSVPAASPVDSQAGTPSRGEADAGRTLTPDEVKAKATGLSATIIDQVKDLRDNKGFKTPVQILGALVNSANANRADLTDKAVFNQVVNSVAREFDIDQDAVRDAMSRQQPETPPSGTGSRSAPRRGSAPDRQRQQGGQPSSRDRRGSGGGGSQGSRPRRGDRGQGGGDRRRGR